MNKLLPTWLLFVAVPCISACQSPLGPLNKTDVFILPKGYVGRVVIFYDQPNGVPDKVVGGERIFVVPKGGVVLTQAPPSPGWAEFPRYYYDEISASTRIPTRTDWDHYSVDSTNATLISSGSFERKMGHVRVVVGEFFVGTRSQIDSLSERAETIDIESLLPLE